MNLLFDHLWQSTAVLAVIGLLTLLFRDNSASVRHALWTAASLKFLLPFALLNWLGIQFSELFVQPLPAPVVQAVFGAAQPFSDGPVFRAMPSLGNPNWLFFLAIWFMGSLALLALWTSRRIALGKAVRAARDAGIAAPMRVKLSTTRMEPGLVGILRPVLLLPEGIVDKLSSAELRAIISHEACHMRRRDNLLALLHMLAQALFWFWPPIWWLGTRLIAERENACDEAVLMEGNDPHTYAQTILKVCRHYVQTSLPCAAGVAGADLRHRLESIMKNDAIIRLDRSRKALLAATVAALLVLPVVLGVPMAGAPARAQAAPGLVIRTVDPEPGRAGAEPVRLKLGGIDETLWLRRDGQIAGNVLAEAQVATGPDGHPVIMMRFTPGAQGLFADMTTKNVGRRIALLVDGEVINAPVVLEPMPGAGVQLSGDFDMERARLLAARMMGKPILP